ncbi:MAG TPA: hypothetical protein VG942_01215 [Hyphomonadaceae bacterium]|nr:hypothetical protein [Hyphomonadaceae bacterium]
MIRTLLAATVVAAVTLTPVAMAPAFAQEAAASTAKYSVEKQTIGELVKNEKTKAVLMKHLPELIANPQLEQGYEMKFADIVQYVPDQLTPEKLKAIDADLAKITD